MKRMITTPEVKASLEAAHQDCERRTEGDQIKAILLRSEGWSGPQVSQAQRIHQSTVIRHL